MKKLLSLLIALALVALAACALAEETEVLSGAAELVVPEEEVALGGVEEESGYADFVGDIAVSAASGSVRINATNFPDEVLRSYIEEEFDEDGNGTLSPEELENATGIYVDDSGVKSLKGIELFPELNSLYCDNNGLTKLDISKNPKLAYLRCESNALTSLDVSHNPELINLYCDSNALTGLDVSKNPELRDIRCKYNQIREMDISNNPKLQTFECSVNGMTRLTLGSHADLTWLACDINSLKALDISGCTGLTNFYCQNNELESLDFSGNAALVSINCSENKLTRLDLSGCAALEELYAYLQQLTAVDVSRSPALKQLSVSWNQIKAVDVSRNPELTSLIVSGNPLSGLDVSGNPKLEMLECDRIGLTALDISKNPLLTQLSCFGNALTTVDVSACPVLQQLVKLPLETSEEYVGFSRQLKDWSVEFLYIGTEMQVVANGNVLYQPKVDLSGAKLSAIADKTYTGSAIQPKVTVKLNGATLKKDTDYKVSYKNNKNVGKATVTVKGVGKYEGNVKKTFRIVPKKVSGLKVKAGAKKLTVSWTKGKGGITGYEIQYATNAKFTKAKKATIKSAKTVKKALTGLKAKKTYYVRIRAYKKVGGAKYYSAWAKYKKVKTK